MAMNPSPATSGVRVGHAHHIRFITCRVGVRAPVRAVPERLDAGSAEASVPAVAPAVPFAVSNILLFLGRSPPRVGPASGTAEAPREDDEGFGVRRPVASVASVASVSNVLLFLRRSSMVPLLRALVVLLRLLPYAVRSRMGAYGFLDPQAKRGKRPDKNGLISRHRLENLLGIGIHPAHLPTYHRALTHPSAVVNRADSFERLELLGDGVLTLVARELLLERLPSANEGMITIQTSALVSNECISSIAQWLGVGRYIRGHCIDANNSRGILCDSFEALVGAVYTDKGLKGARAFIIRILRACPFVELDSMRLERNYVAELKLLARGGGGRAGAASKGRGDGGGAAAAGGGASSVTKDCREGQQLTRRLRMSRSVVSKKPKHSRRTALPRIRYRVEIHDERTGEVVGVGESYTIVIAEQYAAKEVVEGLPVW